MLASEAPVPPVVLPRTGAASGQVAILGLTLFGLGLALMALAALSGCTLICMRSSQGRSTASAVTRGAMGVLKGFLK